MQTMSRGRAIRPALAAGLAIGLTTMLAPAAQGAVFQPSIASSVGSGSTAPSSTAAPPVPAPNGVAGTDETVTLTLDGVARSYTVFVPNHLMAGQHPLMVVLHNLYGSAGAMEKGTNFDVGAANVGALIVYPQGTNYSWNAGACCGTARDTQVDDMRFLNAVLDDVEARFPIDTNRIAMGGWSNGGMMSYRFACEGAGRVRTFFIGSGLPVAPTCTLPASVGILHMHGLLDQTVPWAGSLLTALTPTGELPAVKPSVNALAVQAGCLGWTKTAASVLVTKYLTTGCPANTTFTILSSSTMPHQWVTGSANQAKFGLDETALAWSFALSRWSAAAKTTA